MSSLVRTLEKRILKTLGLKRERSKISINPTTGLPAITPIKKGHGDIMSRDGDTNYGKRWPRLVRTNAIGTRPTFEAHMSAATR